MIHPVSLFSHGQYRPDWARKCSPNLPSRPFVRLRPSQTPNRSHGYGLGCQTLQSSALNGTICLYIKGFGVASRTVILIDQQVFIADAKEAGVEVTSEEVDAAIDEIRETIPEGFEFEDALAQEGLTEDQFVSMMDDQLHAQAYAGELAQEDEYQDVGLGAQQEIGELLSVLMFELDATQHQVMAERVGDVRGEYDTEVNVDFEDVEAPEPAAPELPEQPLPQPEEPAPQPDVPM